jgi:hypothetical protein
MCCGRVSLSVTSTLILGLMPLLFLSGRAAGQTPKDPHRPACTDARCRKIKAFLKTHYCGEDVGYGCKIKAPRARRPAIEVLADYDCDSDESKCQQHGEPSPIVRNILTGELHRLGLPPNAKGFFRNILNFLDLPLPNPRHSSKGNSASLWSSMCSHCAGKDPWVGIFSPAVWPRKEVRFDSVIGGARMSF